MKSPIEITLEKHNVKYKHVRRDWIGIYCINPSCPNPNRKLHLGINLISGGCTCWKCGKKKLIDVLSEACHISKRQAYKIIQAHFKTGTNHTYKPTRATNTGNIKLPTPHKTTLPKRHRKYLQKRNYDPTQIQETWNIKATEEYSSLEYNGRTITYNWRIIAPVYISGKLVSFQCRDITGLAKEKYMACPLDVELIHHKDTLYGLDFIKQKALVVEGITDVWRMGKGTVCTFGTGWSVSQARTLANLKQVFIMFDPEKKAQEKAEELADCIKGINYKTEVEIISYGDTDPGDLSNKDARYLRKELGF
jgi:hypothetical protein